MEPLISARDLKKNFGKVEALKGVSLDVAEGEKVVVIGPSGSGKSVLIRSINGCGGRREGCRHRAVRLGQKRAHPFHQRS